MKKLLLAALMAMLCPVLSSVAQNLKTDSIFNWGKSGWELPADMVSDPDGNFYITESFSGEMAKGNQALKSSGKRDIFLAKFTPDTPYSVIDNTSIGMTSHTDPNGKTTYYEYNSFGRLVIIKDHEENILKEYKYNYTQK